MPSSHPEPPPSLDEPLEVDPADWAPRQVYFLLTGLVVPRPIAWVSTISPDGVRNVAPHSYFNAVAHDPPHVAFSSSGRKDTLRNIEATGEFVVNVTTREVLEAMNFTAGDFPPEEDEFDWARLTEAPSARVAPPRVAESKAHLECEAVGIVPTGNANLIIGRVVHFHVDPSVWHAGRVDPRLLDPVARLGGTGYAFLSDFQKLARPTWEQVRGHEVGGAPFPTVEPMPPLRG